MPGRVQPAGAYSPAEELANAITHGVGILLSLVGLVVLVAQAIEVGHGWTVLGVAVYGATLVLLYLASTLYHAVSVPGAKRVLKRTDHAAIYLLIAGTYTPFCLGPLQGPWGWSLLAVVWGLGLVGALTDVLSGRRFRWLSLVIYLLMGWLVVTALRPLLASVDRVTLAWLAAGGLAYTGGVGFYVARRLPWHHAIWHVFVLAGSVCHWVAVQRVVTLG